MQPASARECLPNTRVQLLETIMHWALDSTGIRSFLLYGTAGQGKSAVAHSVARQLGEMGVTVAFFAFDRVIHELSASQLFPTISKKLASRDPHYLKQLLALPVDLLETTDIADQCELLFLSCLRNHVVSKPTLIIIDALDECPNDSEDSMDRREELLRALRKCISDDLHYRIRFLVTTRLESDIQDTFSDDSLLTRLHCIDTNADTNTDIRKFVASKLTGRQISVTTLRPEFTVTSVAFSPDGSSIASVSRGPTVRLWDTKTGQQKGEKLHGHPTFVPSVTLSPDGATVVHGSTNNYTPRFWGTPEGYECCIDSVVFSHNGTLIVSGARDGSVRIWDTATQQQLGSPLLGHEDNVISVAISRNDASIASGSCDGTVCVWDIEGRQLISTWHGHAGCVYAVAFSPDDDTRIVTVTGERPDTVTTRIWDATSGKQVGDDLRSHSPGHCVYSVALSPDGQHVASGSYDCTIRVWDVREAKKRTDTAVEHTSAITSISCSSDGKYIVSGSQDKTVQLWDAQMGYPVGEPMMGHDAVVNCVSFSPDNTRVASASNDMTVRVWDVQARLPVSVELCGHVSSVYCVAFSPDGTCLVSGSADRTLRIWDLATGKQLGDALHGHEERVRSVSFSSDGFSIASGSDDGTVRLWDARTQLQRGDALKGHVHWVWSVAFSHDGACLVSASSDQKIRLWDAYTGKQMGEPLTGHTDWVRFVSLSPDGKYAVSGSDDRTVRVWNVQTRQQVGDALRGHEKLVMSAAFSPDGTRIVSGCHDGTIRIWDFENLRRQENLVDVVNTSSTGLRKQETFSKEQKDLWNGWMVCEGYDGSEQPLLWIPHHLRHYHRITSPYQIQFVPPVPHIRITLSDLFRINEWPTYTPEPA
ncbi:WD40 repeat-like protein [Schizophyllum commune Loenen D]|nr:WD40 repeat-like protein [Schizophyllum commune Loenen D]